MQCKPRRVIDSFHLIFGSGENENDDDDDDDDSREEQ